jgi:hypothetical protein
MNMKNLSFTARLVVVIVGLGLFTTHAYAQQEKGDKEIQLQGSFLASVGKNGNSTSAADTSVFTGNFKFGLVAANFGYFLTRRQEIGVGGFALITSGSDKDDSGKSVSSTTVIASPNVFYRYNFAGENTKVFPYLSVEVGGSFVSGEDAKLLSPRASVGMKYFFKRNTAFDVNTGYSRYFVVGQDRSGSIGTLDVRMGISFIF